MQETSPVIPPRPIAMECSPPGPYHEISVRIPVSGFATPKLLGPLVPPWLHARTFIIQLTHSQIGRVDITRM